MNCTFNLYRIEQTAEELGRCLSWKLSGMNSIRYVYITSL